MPINKVKSFLRKSLDNGWSRRIRTFACRYQKAMPYHLAIPHGKDGIRTHGTYIRWFSKPMP